MIEKIHIHCSVYLDNEATMLHIAEYKISAVILMLY